MYAIVEIAGQQFKIEKDQKLFVHRLQEDEGASINIDKVLLLGNGDNITLGAPAVEGAFAEAKVLGHLKGDKVIVFKKKRRKGYRKKNGHRQYLTQIQISSISASGGKKSESKKAAAPAKAEKAPAKKSAGKADDLKKIEGIGPKIASTLVEAGIATFADLAKADPANISEIIAGVRGNHVPTTWPQQAQLAVDGKWDELQELQDRLDGGVEK
ncbi:LSU ribosomal protein L21P [Nonlabens xylanidelens]|uniref:Large ribosomal subunit protein bL21 n=1 Tax=Nonlabens xylanidelens TaxID=191564 RepID=A0A2S6IRY2_9FLAO|nr:50S ribosomal protein L21 [Nonlabens xylanidelens]PPK96796.1 LSU ribosomal protein L21P [Nonlabens xylanidelens]PQJ13502.1 50S ribosomal protein L21 [Nonlabens xylanidelens]